jgi:hypothetical protein
MRFLTTKQMFNYKTMTKLILSLLLITSFSYGQTVIIKNDPLYQTLIKRSIKINELSGGDAIFVVDIIFGSAQDSSLIKQKKMLENGIYSYRISSSHPTTHVFTVDNTKFNFLADKFEKCIPQAIKFANKKYQRSEDNLDVASVLYFFYKEARDYYPYY